MKRIRLLITFFIAAIVATCALGWRWSASLPPVKRSPDRLVLSVAALAALGAAAVIWTAKPRRA